MPTWTIISPKIPVFNSTNDHGHPMRIHIYRVMKAVYHMLDPSNEPISTVDEVNHIATLEYADSQEHTGPPEISSLVIHLRLSTQTDTRFDVVLRDMQIEDKVEGACVSLPGELTPVLTDISTFVREFVFRRSAIKWKPASDCSFGNRVWQQIQAEKYHQRVSQQEAATGTLATTGFCSLCSSSLLHCKSCRVASCLSPHCRGSSEPPVVRCVSHRSNGALCFPCLEDQGSKRELEKCSGCKSWCCATDIGLCDGHPSVIPSVPRASSIEQYLQLITTCIQSTSVHPPKRGSCGRCKLPGWRKCKGNACWSRGSKICRECARGGVTCACRKVWACDTCAEHDSDVFIRCPRCDRPFCASCIYINRCKRCCRATLCYDCAEEAPDADNEVVETFAKLTGRCESCGERVCNYCAPIKASWFSCPGCLEMKTRRRANDYYG